MLKKEIYYLEENNNLNYNYDEIGQQVNLNTHNYFKNKNELLNKLEL